MLAHSKCLINQMASLNEVAWDVSHVLFGDDDNLTRADLEEKVHGWHRVLLEWSRNIPPCMDYRRSRLPGVLLMQ